MSFDNAFMHFIHQIRYLFDVDSIHIRHRYYNKLTDTHSIPSFDTIRHAFYAFYVSIRYLRYRFHNPNISYDNVSRIRLHHSMHSMQLRSIGYTFYAIHTLRKTFPPFALIPSMSFDNAFYAFHTSNSIRFRHRYYNKLTNTHSIASFDTIPCVF